MSEFTCVHQYVCVYMYIYVSYANGNFLNDKKHSSNFHKTLSNQ